MSRRFRFLVIPTVLALIIPLAACKETMVMISRGSVEVTTATVGVDIDPDGYVARITGGTRDEMRNIGTNATITVANLDAGMYVVSLEGVAANCAVANNGRTIEVRGNFTTREDFSISCGVAPSRGMRGGPVFGLRSIAESDRQSPIPLTP